MSVRVAIVFSSAGQRALAGLARDAIAKFTTLPHDIYSLDHTWPDPPNIAHLKALEALRKAITDASHVFLMHDDSLPLRAGWLSYLLARPLPAAAIVSRRSGRGQSAGTLYDVETFMKMDLGANLPAYDVAESVAPGWRAENVQWRGFLDHYPSSWIPPEWVIPFTCDLALMNDGEPFLVHLGGGTIGTPAAWGGSKDHAQRIKDWCAAARWALGL